MHWGFFLTRTTTDCANLFTATTQAHTFFVGESAISRNNPCFIDHPNLFQRTTIILDRLFIVGAVSLPEFVTHNLPHNVFFVSLELKCFYL